MLDKFQVLQVPKEAYDLSQNEPMGSKSKFWFKEPTFGRCLYKYTRPNTGEYWAEKIASELAELLQLPHARYELAETWEGNFGIISLNFVPKGGTLIHGNEILTPLIPNYPTYDKYGASQHTIDVVFKAIQNLQVTLPQDVSVPNGIQNAVDMFVGYLLLDAWIGNGDRHHENWGFIRQKGNSYNILYLAPTYDHASSLGRELSDEKRKVRSVEAYTQKCLSAFYRNVNDLKPLKTFELFCEVANRYPHAVEVWLSCLENISTEKIDLILQRFPTERLSLISAQFAKKILMFNQKRLLSLRK
jgi:hypothetical protein